MCAQWRLLELTNLRELRLKGSRISSSGCPTPQAPLPRTLRRIYVSHFHQDEVRPEVPYTLRRIYVSPYRQDEVRPEVPYTLYPVPYTAKKRCVPEVPTNDSGH